MENSLRYRNFDLHLAGAPGAYTAAVQESPAGQTPAAPMMCDLDALSERAADAEGGTLVDLGRALWRCAFGPRTVAELWRGSLTAASGRGGLRLRLIIEAPELAGLPWELLYDETLGRFMALDGLTPVVRFIRLPFAAAAWPQDRPLRLHFTGASPQGLPPLDVAGEWASLEGVLAQLAAAGRLKLNAVPTGAGLSAVLTGLREGVDIWHFAGHGDQGGLFFADRQGRSAAAEAGTVGQLLAGEGLQLAVINACRAGSSGGSAASVAGALVRADIPAVVAMQGALTDEAATTFAGAFYGAIAAGQPVDRAVTSARKAVLALGGVSGAGWWLPALFMRSPDGVLWQQPEETPTAARPTMTAATSDSSALAQGTGTKAVGPRGALIEGDVRGDLTIEGDGKRVITAEIYVENQTVQATAGPDPAALRACYLNHVFEGTRQLALAGIDPKAASEAEARLSLGAVYTALMTLTPKADERSLARTMPDREARRLSALAQLDHQPRLVLLGDPGSGKTTFVNFVALCLAGEALGQPDAHLKLLTEPLPPEDDRRSEREEKAEPQPWRHGALLPVRVILRDFAARGLPPTGQAAGAADLWRFIAAELEPCELGDYAPHLRQELLEQGGLLLLDGLDEVPEADRRRVQLKQAVEGFAASFPRCRILVTSRTYAYQRQDWRLAGFAEAVLAPFERGQIIRFVERWYAHIAALRRWNTQDAQGRAELLKRAILGSPNLIGLAERPLLLTLMASLHAWRGGTLPEKRVQLYADTVDLLLDHWESPKIVRDAAGRPVVQQPSLAEWLRVDRGSVRTLLNELAFWAHSSQPELTGTADIPQEKLVGMLLEISRNPEAAANPVLLVDYLSQRAGILIPRGVKVYTFPHRTFQEYLAACHLADYGYPAEVARLARAEPNRWREVALLAAARVAENAAWALWPLVESLCPAEPAERAADKDAWAALIAGQALIETSDPARLSLPEQDKQARVQRWLVHILKQGDLPAVERARGGDLLARLGDPRFDQAAWGLPAESLLGFVEIPIGPFRMGSDPKKDKDASSDEQPQHDVILPAFYIARYPTTTAQFRTFVDDSGYQPRDPDCLTGLANYPVVWVTWHDALAYCDWLTGKLGDGPRTPEPLRGLLRGGKWRVTLPSEAEWEKAARGTDGRIYPWGDRFDTDCANIGETGIGHTTAGGCFPRGASPYGVLDMSGNVWEWTRSLQGKYPYPIGGKAQAERENLKVSRSASRVLRGGAFNYIRWGARCACRDSARPVRRCVSVGFRVVVSPIRL